MSHEPIRVLLADAAARATAYLESLDTRPVYPTAPSIARLRQVLDAPLPAAPAISS